MTNTFPPVQTLSSADTTKLIELQKKINAEEVKRAKNVVAAPFNAADKTLAAVRSGVEGVTCFNSKNEDLSAVYLLLSLFACFKQVAAVPFILVGQVQATVASVLQSNASIAKSQKEQEAIKSKPVSSTKAGGHAERLAAESKNPPQRSH